MNKCYYRIVWEDYSSDKTPLNAQNLNRMDSAIDEMDNRIISLDSTKFDKAEAQLLVKYIEYDESTGIFRITHYNGASYTIDTLLEKLAINFDYDYQTQRLIIELSDGTAKYVDLSALITQYEFLESDTVHFVISADGKVKAEVKEGSIQEKHLRPNYLADIRVETAKAQQSATNAKVSEDNAKASEIAAGESESNAAISASDAAKSAESSKNSATIATEKASAASESASNAENSAITATAKADDASTSAENASISAENAETYAQKSQSYAVGGTQTRENEDFDNAKYYYEKTKDLNTSIEEGVMATPDQKGLMSAHDKSWLDGKFRRYIYGSDAASEDKKGYYKIASVESDLLNHSYAIRLLIWSLNHANFPVAPAEVTVYFQTGSRIVNSTKVFAYCDLATTSSQIFKDIVVKHTVNAAVGKCEIYFDRNIDTATITIDVMGEMERNVTTSEEKYQKVWTFYDNFIAPDPIEEEGYVFKSLIECMNGATVGSDTTPIYIDKGIPKPCASLPAGTTDYNDLDNKPSINGIELSGNKRPYDLGVCPITSQRDLGLGTPQTAVGYVIVNGQIYGQPDGAMYEQAYSENFFHQIYGDYRTGQIATRGRNNGTWGAFRRQLDEFNYSNFINSYDNAIHARNPNIGDNKYIKIIIDRSKADAKSSGFFGAFTVRIYENYRATDYLISGYNYLAGSTAWLNPCASILGGTPFIENGSRGVKFGYDSDEEVYVIFDIGQYVGVSVFGFVEGYYSLTNDINIRKIFRIEFVPEITGTIEKMVTCYYPIHHHEQNMYIGGGQSSLRYESLGLMSVLPAGPSAIRYYFKSFTEAEGGGGMFMPSSNGGVHLGASDHRWRDIYLATAPNVSSDSREKTDQKPLDDELTEKFVLGLKPKSYKRIDGTSGRRHHGLIAPEVEELMNTLGISSLDFAGFVKSPKMEEEEYEDPETGESQTRRILIEGEYTYSLRYEEFIPMLIKMIQLQHSRIKVLENENLQLSERMSRIEEYLELV